MKCPFGISNFLEEISSLSHSIIFSLGSKIPADGDCGYEIKRCLHLEREVVTHLTSMLKSRDITLLTKIYIVKAVAFLIVMYYYTGWITKKGEHQRTDFF